jgi:hypothetical protein
VLGPSLLSGPGCALVHPRTGGEPSSRQIDELLDERLTRCGRSGEDVAVGTQRQVRGATFHPRNLRLLTPVLNSTKERRPSDVLVALHK